MRGLFAIAMIAGCGDDPCASQRLSSAAATQVASDGEHVYWSEPGALVRARTDGGGREVVANADVFGSGIMVVDGVGFWAGEAAGAAAVMADATPLATIATCPVYPNVVVDGDTVFAATFACDESAAELVAVPRGGGEPLRTVLATGTGRIVAGDGAAQMVIGDELVSIAAATGEPTTLAQVIDADVLARDASDIFLASGMAVVAVPAAGGAVRDVARFAARPTAAVVAGELLVVVADGTLFVVRADGLPRDVAQTDAATLASDASAIYRAETTGVVRTPTCGVDP